jgi:transposase
MTTERQTEAEIRRLFFGEHWKRGTIATQLELHHDVVDRVVGPHGPAPKSGEPRPSVLAPYHGFLLETLERYPTLVATRLYDMIGERGYCGSIRTLRRFVLLNRPAPKREVFLRLETLPGEQSQIDWAHVGSIRVQGGVRPLYCFVLLLRYSRAMWAELVLEQTTVSLLRSLVRAAQYFGGVTHEWLFDNPKSIVAAREGSAIRFQAEFVEIASQLCVALRACRIRKPTDKGGVERAIRYLKTRFFPARVIPSVESGNAALLHFLETVANQRPHPTQKDRTVADVLAEEKTRLLPPPSPRWLRSPPERHRGQRRPWPAASLGAPRTWAADRGRSRQEPADLCGRLQAQRRPARASPAPRRSRGSPGPSGRARAPWTTARQAGRSGRGSGSIGSPSKIGGRARPSRRWVEAIGFQAPRPSKVAERSVRGLETTIGTRRASVRSSDPHPRSSEILAQVFLERRA